MGRYIRLASGIDMGRRVAVAPYRNLAPGNAKVGAPRVDQSRGGESAPPPAYWRRRLSAAKFILKNSGSARSLTPAPPRCFIIFNSGPRLRSPTCIFAERSHIGTVLSPTEFSPYLSRHSNAKTLAALIPRCCDKLYSLKIHLR